MSIKEEDVTSGRLVYSCHCGWIDTSHAKSTSTRPFVSARSLWNQILNETGQQSKIPDAKGFKVIYKQDMGNSFIKAGKFGRYMVKYELTHSQKESVALAIFREISEKFETYQEDFFFGWTSHSSFSQEDLTSNLLGFYKVVRPNVDYQKICLLLDKDKSLEVFKSMSDTQRAAKSKSWASPISYTCKHCPKAEFPKEFQTIVPALKGGKNPLFRDWTTEDEFGVIPKAMPRQTQGATQKGARLQGEDLKLKPRTGSGKNFNLRND